MRDAIRTFPCRDGSFTGEWREYSNVTGGTAINPSKVFGRSPSQTYLLKSSKFTVYSCLPTQLIYLSKLKFWRIIMDLKTEIYLLLAEFLFRTVSYGPSFFSIDLWPKREARGP